MLINKLFHILSKFFYMSGNTLKLFPCVPRTVKCYPSEDKIAKRR